MFLWSPVRAIFESFPTASFRALVAPIYNVARHSFDNFCRNSLLPSIATSSDKTNLDSWKLTHVEMLHRREEESCLTKACKDVTRKIKSGLAG